MYALVTGATSGIGKEISFILAKKGYSLLLTGRREERLIHIKKQIESQYPIDVQILSADLCQKEEIKKLIEWANPFNVSVLINNAGFGKLSYFDELDLDQEIAMIKTNIMALHVLMKWFVVSYQEGYILNVASIAAYQPVPLMATYGATKAYVLSLSQAVGYECKKQGKKIHISTLCPGPVDTEFNAVAGSSFNLPSISPSYCATKAIDGLFKGKREILPSLSMKLTRFASRFAPATLSLPIEYWIQTSKRKK